VLRRVGRSEAHVTMIINFHGGPVMVEDDRRGEGIHDLPSGSELVLTLENVIPGTHLIVEWSTRWQRQLPRVWKRRVQVWSAPIY